MSTDENKVLVEEGDILFMVKLSEVDREVVDDETDSISGDFTVQIQGTGADLVNLLNEAMEADDNIEHLLSIAVKNRMLSSMRGMLGDFDEPKDLDD